MTRPDSDQAGQGVEEQPFISHLIELRTRILRALGGVLLVFLALAPFADSLFHWLSGPLSRHLPEGSSLIAIEVASPFLVPFKLALVSAFFLAMPMILYQFWAFVAPGLYRHEKRLVLPLMVSSSLLFYAGAAFAYYVVFPLMFSFFSSAAPEGVSVMTDISRYLDFVLTLFFAFGAAFEVPVATFILVRTGVVSAENLAAKRPYIIVAAFVVGMLLTPPDVISQTLLAVPIWMLFELGLLMSRTMGDAKNQEHVTGQAGGLSDAEMDAELDRIEAEESGFVDGEPKR